MTTFPDSTPIPDTVTIPLSKGYSAVVDACDADLARFKWKALVGHRGNVYGARNYGGRATQRCEYLHRVILSRMLGRDLAKHELTDHISGDGLDCRRSNIRVATSTQNLRNSKRRSDNSSGFKGVTRSKSGNKWRARIKVNGKVVHLGYFDSPKEAGAAYSAAAPLYFGEFASTER